MAVVTYTVNGSQDRDDVLGNLANTAGINNTAAQYDTSYIDLYTHNVGLDSYNSVAGFVFTLPSEMAGVTSGQITDCYLEMYGQNTSTFPVSNGFDCKLINAAPSGNTFPATYTSGNTPLSMYNAATGISGIRWSTATPNGGFTGSWTANTYQRTASVTSHLQTAVTAGATAGSKVTFVLRGVPGGLGTQRINSYNTGSNRPRLIIKVDIPASDNSVTTTAPSAGFAPGDKGGIKFTDLAYDYNNSRSTFYGPGDRRVLDLWEPWIAPPANGYKCMVFVHGGSFTGGDKNVVDARHVAAGLRRGMAVTSIQYNLSDASGGFNEVSHPMPRQDLGAALTYLTTTRNMDDEWLLLTGYSAGGHIVLEYALTYDDTTTHQWVYTGPAADPRTGSEPDTAPNFRFTQANGAQPRPKAIFVWAAPFDLGLAGTGNTLLAPALRGYFGGKLTGDTYSFGVENGEGDLNYLALGTAGKLYAGKPHGYRLAGIPIGYMEARWGAGGYTGPGVGFPEETVVPASGIESVKSTLTSIGIPDTPNVSTVNGLNTKGGLSHWRREVYVPSIGSFPHDFIYGDLVSDTFTESSDFGTWLTWLEQYVEAISPANSAAFTVPTPTVSTTTGTDASHSHTAEAVPFTVPTPTVSIGQNVTTTAPSAVAVASSSAGTPATIATTTAPAVDWLVIEDVVIFIESVTTTTAPAAAAAVGTVDVSISGAVTTTAPAVFVAEPPTPGVSTSGNNEHQHAAQSVAVTVGVPTAEGSSPGQHTVVAEAIPFTVPTPDITTAVTVTTTAPVADAFVGAADATATGDASHTVTAPALPFTVGSSVAAVVTEAITTAAAVIFGITVPSVSTNGNNEHQHTAEPVTVALGTADASGSSPGSADTTAPTVGAGVGTVTVVAGTEVITTAPTVTLAPATTSVTGTASVLAEAVSVALSLGNSPANTGAIYIISAALLASKWRARLQR